MISKPEGWNAMERAFAGIVTAILWLGPASAAISAIVPASGTLQLSIDYTGATGLGSLSGAATGGTFEVSDYSFSIEQTLDIGSQSSGAGSGKVTFNEFTINNLSDQAIPGFAIGAITHKPDDSVVPVFGFATLDSAPALAPAVAPVLAPWQPGDPCFQSGVCRFSGVLVAYDAPVQVGTFDMTFTPVPEPASSSLILLGMLAAACAVRRA
jgi:PEP-CTERM motif-containing protein